MGPFDIPWTSLQMFWKILLYILHHTPPCHIYICRWPTFLHYRILVFWNYQEVFDGNASFKVDLYPILVACSLLIHHSMPSSNAVACNLYGLSSATKQRNGNNICHLDVMGVITPASTVYNLPQQYMAITSAKA